MRFNPTTLALQVELVAKGETGRTAEWLEQLRSGLSAIGGGSTRFRINPDTLPQSLQDRLGLLDYVIGSIRAHAQALGRIAHKPPVGVPLEVREQAKTRLEVLSLLCLCAMTARRLMDGSLKQAA